MPLIYKLIGAGDECYIGATTRTLDERFRNHKKKSNKTMSRILFDKYGRNGVKIVLLEEVENIENLKIRETYWIDNTPTCVNKQRSIGLTDKETIDYRHNYYENNKTEILKEAKQYYIENKEEKKEKTSQYREVHRKEINEKMKTKYECDCGGHYTYVHKSRHLYSPKHLTHLRNLVET